ncbi:MAG: TatD family hydrolase [Pseudomonadota bacterium]
MYIDSHAHLDFPDYDSDRELVVQRAKDAGVERIITIGTNLDASFKAIQIAAWFPEVFAAVGIHPHDAKTATHETYETLMSLAAAEKVVAIGETGLDFFKEYSRRDEQEIVFRKHIGLAKEVNLPLIIHDRDAHDAVLRILREENARDTGGVFHCFAGDYAFAGKCLDLGFYISFTGVITFPKAASLREVAEKAPLDRLLIETDSPFLSPVPYRGRRNEPAYVGNVAKMIAEIRKVPVEEIARCTRENAEALFRLPVL